ncbi:MAG: hypothetical protein KBF76_12420 [Verrucomicrobiales bacterium]|nr:hypothetical protein [Verrucomicrobiales bacterium]
MPSEVISEWLVHPMRTHGWPPSGVNWEGALLGRSVEFWNTLDWRCENLLPGFDDFDEESKQTIEQVIRGNFYGEANPVTAYMASKGKEKLQDIVDYVGEHGRLPSSLVALELDTGLALVDGYHRLATHFHMFRIDGVSHVEEPPEIWIGTPA